jgi:hypothetical protein
LAAQTDLRGAWHGSVWRHPATLDITRHAGDSLAGIVRIRTDRGDVRVAVAGAVDPDTGRLNFWATRTLSAPRGVSYDLGRVSSGLTAQDRMAGTVIGRRDENVLRVYFWSFQR